MTTNESGLVRAAGKNLSVEERGRIRNLPDLGKYPDTVLAKREGVSKFTIARARRLKGIPTYRVAKVELQMSEISVLINNWRR